MEKFEKIKAENERLAGANKEETPKWTLLTSSAPKQLRESKKTERYYWVKLIMSSIWVTTFYSAIFSFYLIWELSTSFYIFILTTLSIYIIMLLII